MQGQRVLVTGNTGFIRSNLANHLAEANDVVAGDDGYLGTDVEPEYVENPILGFCLASVFSALVSRVRFGLRAYTPDFRCF